MSGQPRLGQGKANPAAARGFGDPPDAGIVLVHHPNGLGPHGMKEFALGRGHACQAAQTLQMRRVHGIDAAQVRIGDAGQGCDFTGCAHAHFHDGHAVARMQGQQ